MIVYVISCHILCIILIRLLKHVDNSLPSYAAATSTNPFTTGETISVSDTSQDVNGNKNQSEELEGAVGGVVSASQDNIARDMPVKHTIDHYEMPPFIVPPINIMDFFKATGKSLKCISQLQ